MTKVSKKLQRDDLLRKKRMRAATAWPTAAKEPPRASPGPSAPFPAHRYPSKRASLGLERVARPVNDGSAVLSDYFSRPPPKEGDAP